MSLFSFLPENARARDVWNIRPGLESAWQVLPSRVLTAPSELSKSEKAVIAAYYSILKGYGTQAGAEQLIEEVFGVRLSLDGRALRQVIEGSERDLDGGKFAPILAYVHKLATASYKLMQRDADKVLSAGWGERTLTDVVVICATMSMYVSTMLGHCIDPPGAIDA
ncbi:MAG: hypothetical protein ACPHN2_00835 [Sinimarinibacterium flocculans]|uniref:hypothetical protein n=1 Tax=Sinimarinibacterium flocculans TaxID=985250 RepID=UPI003C4C5749